MVAPIEPCDEVNIALWNRELWGRDEPIDVVHVFNNEPRSLLGRAATKANGSDMNWAVCEAGASRSWMARGLQQCRAAMYSRGACERGAGIHSGTIGATGWLVPNE